MREQISDYLHETAKLIYCVLDSNGEIQTTNRFTDELLGRDIIGKQFMDIVLGTPERPTLSTLLAQGESEHLFSVLTKAGEAVSFLFTFSRSGPRTALFGRPDYREMETMNREIYRLNRELSDLSRELEKKNAKLQYALSHIRTLQGIIPICMHCYKIRTDRCHWDKLEAYIEEHTHAEFSHSICEECLEKYYPPDNDDESESTTAAVQPR